MHEGAHEVVELVQDAVDHLDEQVPLLVLEGGRHEQRQDLVEERPRAQLARLVGDLAEGLLAHRRRAVLHLEQQLHDLPLARLLRRDVLELVVLLEERREVLVVLGLDEGQPGGRGGHVLLQVALLLRQPVEWRLAGPGRGRGHQLARRRADGHVGVRRLEDLVALRREHRVQVVVGERPVALLDLALPAHLLDLLGRRRAHGPAAQRPQPAHHGRLRVDRAHRRRARRHAEGARRAGRATHRRLVPARALPGASAWHRHGAAHDGRRVPRVAHVAPGSGRLVPPVLARGRRVGVGHPPRRRRRIPPVAVGAAAGGGRRVPLTGIRHAARRRRGVPPGRVHRPPRRRRRVPLGRVHRAAGGRGGVPAAAGRRVAPGRGRGVPLAARGRGRGDVVPARLGLLRRLLRRRQLP
mmetsp:Transcript_18179/g.45574  ORF Transcript_18179/g.45574 Transcript_18179/m.45574 type:complete len:411 (+) Transcript_18179:2372-3604(+)